MDNAPVEDQLRHLEFLSGIALRIQDDVIQLKSWITAKFGELYQTQHPSAVNLLPPPPPLTPMAMMAAYQQYNQTQAHFGFGFGGYNGAYGQDIRIDSFYSISGEHNYHQQQRMDNFNINGLNNIGLNLTASASSTTAAAFNFNEDTTSNDGGNSNHDGGIDDENQMPNTNMNASSDSLIDVGVEVEIQALDDSDKKGRKHKTHSDLKNIIKRIKVEQLDDNERALKTSQSQNMMDNNNEGDIGSGISSKSEPGSSSSAKDKETPSRRKSYKHQPQKYNDSTTCTVCDKQFKTRSYLQQHMDIHGTFTYTCKMCERTFTTKNSLNVHISTSHSNSKSSRDGYTVKCYEDECTMHFRTVKTMLNHFEEIHNGIECQYCREILFKRGIYNQHLREKHLVCCSTQYVTRAGLILHREKNHSKKKRSMATVVTDSPSQSQATQE